MKCVIDTSIAKYMSQNDYFYIMHRFNLDHTHPVNKDNMEFVELANREQWKTISVSIGVQDHDKEFVKKCWGMRIDYLTIDIAHADSIRAKEMLEFINDLYENSGGYCPELKPFIIAGNVATPEAVINLENWGANATKVGIAAGAACRTFNETGFGVPMFSCIQACAAVAKKPIIGDGGILECGDIAKALVAGATMVMVGGMFARSIDSPANTIYKYVHCGEYRLDGTPIIDQKIYKQYYGSASAYNKHNDKHVEGNLIDLECDGTTYASKLRRIEEHLQSSTSYGGGSLLNVDWGIKNNQKL
jgi:GMP reductase